MHPAVVKAKHVGAVAHEHGWKGSFDSSVLNGALRLTTLEAHRNDETIILMWQGVKLTAAMYSIFDRSEELTSVMSKIRGWPDLVQLFEWFPNMNRPNLTEKYRKLPFDLEDDGDAIIDCLVGKQLWWYNHEDGQIWNDTSIAKRNSKFRILDIGHRKFLHFVGKQAGLRSLFLDTLLKVA